MLEQIKALFAAYRLAIIAAGVAAVLAAIGGAYLKGRSEQRTLTEAEAGKRALQRIQDLEKNNATFNHLDDRGRCLVFMRDSGLPDNACD